MIDYPMSKALERPQGLSHKSCHFTYTSQQQKAMKNQQYRQQQMAKKVKEQATKKVKEQATKKQNSTFNILVNICQQLPEDVLVKVLATATSELQHLKRMSAHQQDE